MLNLSLRNRLFVLLAIAITAGCAGFGRQAGPTAIPEIRPGILAGYLPSGAYPDSLALLPPPPAETSAAFALDREVSRQNLALRGTPRWELATEDAHLAFPQAAGAFSCALGAPITEQDTPHLYMLLRRTLADAGLSTYAAKNHYQRTRPFVINKAPICTPEEEEALRGDGSYPSGHTAIGWAWALILTGIAPEQADAILARGRAFGESRVVCNVHWHSDVVEGRFMGAAAAARLQADPEFRTAVKAAKRELAEARAKGLEPARDCAAEAAALGRARYLGRRLTPVAGLPAGSYGSLSDAMQTPCAAYSPVSVQSESTYYWETEQWSVPVNLAISKLVNFGKLPVSLQAGVGYWAESPDNGPDGVRVRLQANIVLPK